MLNQKLFKKIDLTKLPSHIAIIMDGNGRWANKRLLPRVAGHRAGAQAVDEIVSCCREIGIKALTLFSFSTENWNRPRLEVDALMELLTEYIKKELDRMLQEGIAFNTIGRITDLPHSIQDLIDRAKKKTASNTQMILTLALSYGSRNEILEAVRHVARDVEQGIITVEDINIDLWESYLYTRNLPEPDLLIRTSGEKRISNFLLWQIAYAELYFTDTLWPDFRSDELLKAIIEYQARERRFGLTREQIIREKV